MTLAWDDSPGAKTHHIYYAHEAISDPENYAAHEGGTWLRDAASPLTVSLDDPSPVYRFIVTAEDDNGESEPSNTVIAITRYRVTGPTVIDLTTGLEWMRCSNGQVWDAEADACEGDLIRANWDDIQAARPAGWDVPSVEQFQTLGLCDSGPTTAMFQVPGEPCDPRGEHGIYVPAFPASSFGDESIYVTSTVSVAPHLLRGFSFGALGGNLPGAGIPYLDPGIGVYARFVRTASPGF